MSTSQAERCSWNSSSAEETMAFAERLGALCEGGEVLALTGDLGAGKTHFVKGLAAGLAIDPRRVTSPTFLLIHELDGRLPLVHMDAYRVQSGEELAEAGAADFDDGRHIVAVEWAENVTEFIPEDALWIELRVVGETERRIDLTARGPRSALLLSRLEGES